MNTSTDYKTLVSSSATHAAAIGHFGHVYVWGKNTAFRDFKGSRDADGKMTTITKEDVTCQLGFNDPSIKEIETPIAIRIKHPVYRIIAEQVACGPNFTCIVAKEKESFDLTNQDEDIIIDGDEVAERDTFEEEISEEEIMTRGDLDFLKSPAEIKGTHQEIVIIGRQIRHEISTYLRENQERIMDLFKSSKIREDSFMSIMRQQIQSIVSDAKLRAYIKVKKMRIPGLKLYLKPIYELLKKCRECKGTLYVFGKDISPTKSGNPQSITISENTMGYSLIELPLGVIISKVSCGEDFVLILSISGELLSFGNRKIDALGVKKQTNYNTIASFEPPLFDIIDIVCGQKHCMALRTGGVVFSWGDGQFGKLGHGNSDSTRKPEPIGLDTSAAFLIRAGDRNSICVTDKETIFCFGDSSEKQFGKIGIFEKPERCFMPFSIQDVCIGDKYVVYVSQEGELYVYGPPHLVDLTDNCLSRRYRHLEEVRFINVSGSSDIFFALSTNGSIFSWSYQRSVEDKFISSPNLGRKTSGKQISSVPYEISSVSHQFVSKRLNLEEEEDELVQVEKVAKSSKILKVGCLEENTVLISNAGEVFITGSGKHGQLGISYEANEEEIEEENKQSEDEDLEISKFTLITRLSSVFNIKISSMACGYYHIIAIKNDGGLLSWGLNTSGQLGLGNFIPKHSIPMPIDSLQNSRAIMAAAGEAHSLVLVEENDERVLYAFGSAENGKLGIGSVKSSTLVTTPQAIASLLDVKHISCGENHSAAITNSKNLYLWGEGWKGQLGHGNRDSQYEPKVLSGTMDWNLVECGANHTVALDRNGKILHWGEIYFPDEDTDIFSPIRVKGLEQVPFSMIAAGNGYTLAVTELRNTIYSWGKQFHNRLFTTKTEIVDNDISGPLATPIPNREKVEALSVSRFHGIAVTNDGSLFVWGYGYNGRLGDPEAKLINRCKQYDGNEVDLSFFLEKVDEEQQEAQTDDLKLSLQEQLQNEPEELKENVIREADKQIIKNFTGCIDKFLELSTMDKGQQTFFEKVKHKILSRIQQEPFKCGIIDRDLESNQDLEDRRFAYSALITTYQMHACYTFRMLNQNLPLDRKLTFLNLIYTDIEDDKRLIYTSVYLCQMLLKKKLEEDNLTFPDFLEDPNLIYRKLFVKTICANSHDLDVIRSLAYISITNMINVISDDPHGIDPNPMIGLKTPAQNLITAYAMNRSNVDRRMSKLKSIMDSIANSLKKHLQTNALSGVVVLLVKDLLIQCKNKFKKPITKLELGKEITFRTVHSILNIIFETVELAIKDPDAYLVPLESSMDNQEKNLESLAATVKAFFSGTTLGATGERWYRDLNELNINNENYINMKTEILRDIVVQKVSLEEEAVLALFEHSLQPTDKIITINMHNLIRLHTATKSHLDSLRVNSPSYDPLCLLIESLDPVPGLKSFSKNEMVNLQLMTRALRQDQSLVRCPECAMLVPREMAPNNFKPVIGLYDPMPPNSGQCLMTKILGDGPKKIEKVRMLDYLMEYKSYSERYMKDFEAVDKVMAFLAEVNTKILAKDGIAQLTGEELDIKMAYYRENDLKDLERLCMSEFKRRKDHYQQQIKMIGTLDRLEGALREFSSNSLIPEKTRQRVLFDVEYGASNRELEKFSDSVMFSIMMNKIRDYTVNKAMSIELFENLKDDMKDNLRGFAKRSLTELTRKKIVTEFFIPVGFKPKDIFFTFELEEDFLNLFVTYSPNKARFCGRDEFREEEILFHEKLPSSIIEEMREDLKTKAEGQEKTKTLPEKSTSLRFIFSEDKLIKLIGGIEDQVSAYIQNVKINEGDTLPKAK